MAKLKAKTIDEINVNDKIVIYDEKKITQLITFTVEDVDTENGSIIAKELGLDIYPNEDGHFIVAE